MKRIVGIVLFFLVQVVAAQQSANHWIDYSQSYYKFKIAQDGVYRITRQDLLDANLPLNTIDPRNFQLFAKGKAVPIYIEGESDGNFDLNDFIEFYGEANDGWLDTVFYKGRANQPNPYYSMLNDTLRYYLTWNNSTSNLRIQSENNIDFQNYFKASYVWKELVQFYNTSYYDGEITVGGGNDVEYVPSEGWMDSPLSLGNSKTKNLVAQGLYSSGPFLDFEAQIAGESDWAQLSNGDHHIELSIGNQLFDQVFEGYELIKLQGSFSPTELSSGNNSVQLKSIDDLSTQPNRVDRTALAYLKLTYPHNLSFNNSSYTEFLVDDASGQNAQYIEVLSFNGGSAPILYDVKNGKRIKVIGTLTNDKAIIPNGNGRKKCVLLAENQLKSISGLKAVNATAKFTNYTNQVADSVYVIVTHESLYPEATTYAAYRQSTGHATLIAQMEELYDQFGYGINKNPLAIRNFIAAAFNDWLFPPTHLFLIGKSVNLKDHRKNSANQAKNLVPTMGNPATDNLLIAGLEGTNLEPVVPIGRLSAKTMNEIDLYLDKVIEYESAPTEQWMKRAMHFSGGNSLFQADLHENYLNGFAQDFNSSPFGGEVRTFRKSTSAPYQVSLADSIRTLINEGVSLLTFFGHSAATGGFDISIDSPDQLQNRGKYHVLLANSCFAGNTHQASVLSTSEQYVLERNKGAIAFIASGNLGLPSSLNRYSSAFYENFASKNYGKSLAENMRLAIQEIQSANNSDQIKSVCLEMTLQGDPAVVLNAHEYADYKVVSEGVSISPKEVTTELDSFKVKILIENLGRATNDSLLITMNRRYPNSAKSDSNSILKITPVLYDRYLEFSYPVDMLNGVGENAFSFTVDPFNEQVELNENNNRVDFTVLIRSGEIVPVYPYDYSIVGKQSPKLQASTAFTFEKEQDYVFELDTSAAFSSVAKESKTIRSIGGVIDWQPNSLSAMADSAVYFWRVSKVPDPNEPYNWRTFSFQYLKDESGWSQGHFDQFERNNFLFLKTNQANRKFTFTNNVKELQVQTIGSPVGAELTEVYYGLDADIRERGSCFFTPGILIAVLDSLNLDSWQTPFNGSYAQNDFGQANVNSWCFPDRNRSERIFNFQVNDTAQLFAMRDFINNSIPQGAFVVAFNWFNIDYAAINAIDTSILKAFEKLGSSMLQTATSNYPFIITGQIGNTVFLQEKLGDSIRAKINIKRVLTTSADYGEMAAKEIGPSDQFTSLSYHYSSLESPSQDKASVKLIGKNTNGQEHEILRSDKLALDTSLIGMINPDSINSLRLEMQVEDQAVQTPPQLQRWQVSFTEYPDFALSPNLYFTQNKDSLQQGEELEISVAVKNLTAIKADTLLVNYSVINASNQTKLAFIDTLLALQGDSFLVSEANISTDYLFGANKLIVELNPNHSPKEINTFNNVGQLEFFMIADRLNPLIDVTFNGRHILNREIVSASPQIQISLNDENQFLAIDDTSSFALYLRSPSGSEKLLNYGSNSVYELQFKPATLPENKARVIYSPQLVEDGIYQLRVQAKDKSGNASGNQDYKIEFEVINRSTVSRLLNYPNPFSTSTRFVFTLTGNKVPDQLLIQIMTITGKVVREIDHYELGPIHIGNNITEFAWDGKDEFGDQLANGVYLYRVKMKINGNNIERRESKADQYFTKDFGKMYLLR